jgi:putative transposase
VKYAFIQEHRAEFTLSGMCRVLDVHRSGFYAWLLEPLSPRAVENQALTAQIKEFYEQSMGIYGSPRIFCDLREAGVQCSENRVARLMRMAQIKSVRGYKRPLRGHHIAHLGLVAAFSFEGNFSCIVTL